MNPQRWLTFAHTTESNKTNANVKKLFVLASKVGRMPGSGGFGEASGAYRTTQVV